MKKLFALAAITLAFNFAFANEPAPAGQATAPGHEMKKDEAAAGHDMKKDEAAAPAAAPKAKKGKKAADKH